MRRTKPDERLCLIQAELRSLHRFKATCEKRAEDLTRLAAHRLVDAPLRCEEAEGLNRAISLAPHGEPWTPFALEAEGEALLWGDFPPFGKA
jgi:hypothetical protein